jgi:hypothetical protein
MDKNQQEYLEAESPWHDFTHEGNPQPMIYWLKETAEDAK